jgi:oligoendopeptidase F
MRPQLPEYGAWLRTNRLKDQLGWDGFDTGMHELGHNLEQLCSTFFVPRKALRGVPNTACTEAFAFLYQSLAKRALGIENAAEAERAYHEETIASMLMACQIAGPSLVELRTWRWIYEAGEACTPEGIRDNLLRNAREVWAEFFQEHFGDDPYHILGAYQHMLGHPLYLPDYAIGRTISHQIRSHMQGKDLAAETKRICSIGRVTPDAWMRSAVGGPLSAAPLIEDTAEALCILK